MIGIVDYGLGNVKAFYSIYKSLGIPVFIASSPSDLHAATKIILPGVGSFDWAIELLNTKGFIPELDLAVHSLSKPILGVCVGMQLMCSQSEEGSSPGLGWLDADVVSLAPYSTDLPLPHMGWNSLQSHQHKLFQNIEKPLFYFLHSYAVNLLDPTIACADTSYGHTFCAFFNKANIYGVQFHPEKSHANGIQLLENFAKLS